MPIRRSIATSRDLVPGKTVYLVMTTRLVRRRIVVRAVVVRPVDGHQSLPGWFQVRFFYSKALLADASYLPHTNREISAADRGVPGFNYDDRAPQIFLTRRSAEHWARQWGTRNPNFLTIKAGRCHPLPLTFIDRVAHDRWSLEGPPLFSSPRRPNTWLRYRADVIAELLSPT